MLQRWRRPAVVAAIGLAGLFASRDARSQSASLVGAWSAGPLIETVNVTSWDDTGCGPRPKSGSIGGGTYNVSASGDELVFSGPQPFRTDACFDMGFAKRVSHSAMPATRWWKTRCESPAGDPRKATISTSVRAIDDDTIVLSETAQYSSTVSEGGTCAANVQRTRTFKRQGVTPAPSPTTPPAPSPAPPPEPVETKPSCESPGDAATLEVRPRKKVLRRGESFDFRARLLDTKGCDVPGKIVFRLAPESQASALTVDTTGKVKAKDDAEPVVASIVVEGGGKSARVELEIVSDAKFAELLAAGGSDLPSDDQPVSIVLSGGGGGESTVRDPKVQEGARRRFAYVAIAGGGCTLLALAALVLWRRGSATAAREEAQRAKRGRRVPVEPVRAQPTPPTPMPIATGASTRGGVDLKATVQGFAPAKSCPTCGADAPDGAEFCPNDGARFVVVSTTQAAGRVCPACGRRYEREAAFCSKDGMALVPLN